MTSVGKNEGPGKSYNSMTGVGHMFGKKTKKLVGVCTLSKRCVTCERAQAKSAEPPQHNCRYNWAGSAKGVEPAAAVSIASNLKEDGF